MINYSQSTKPVCILDSISQEGYLAYQVLIGNVNGEIYAQYLIDLYENISNHYQEKNVYLHKIVFKMLKVTPHKLLSTQKPQFNPIEKIWYCFKEYLRKQTQLSYTSVHQEIHKFQSCSRIIILKNIFQYISIFQHVIIKRSLDDY